MQGGKWSWWELQSPRPSFPLVVRKLRSIPCPRNVTLFFGEAPYPRGVFSVPHVIWFVLTIALLYISKGNRCKDADGSDMETCSMAGQPPGLGAMIQSDLFQEQRRHVNHKKQAALENRTLPPTTMGVSFIRGPPKLVFVPCRSL